MRRALAQAGFGLALTGAMTACGGVVRTNDGGSTGAGAAGNNVSRPPTGGATGPRNGSGGNTGSAADDGGVLACSGTGCRPIDCLAGAVPYVPAGSCCPVCGPTCENVECPSLDCAVGETQLTPAGACCTACTIPPVTLTCDQAGYAQFRARLEEKYRNGPCTADWECSAFVTNACGISECGSFAVSSGVYFSEAVGRFHSVHCFGCLAPSSDCLVLPPAACVSGRCELVTAAP